ncbi:hypothetical protein HUG17_6728 [Dermatophagoides farinae]|uniref:Protein kinase domain-containing protein n=1 Tax=Dermatophagoides farinae TaxID=6954 RepID=A0A9D4P435_DERFA|nr:hypothetical protein HUG17_6728 [Dermatophagoides farinae]
MTAAYDPDGPKLVHRNVTRFYEIPFGPYRRPEDVLRSFGYELIRELDRGAYGVVYIAHDLRKEMKVACKQIEMDRTFHRNVFEENKNELLTIERVRHPYVIKVYCHFVVQGNGFNRMYIFMALADGGNLYKFIRNRNTLITEEKCRLYFAQILCGINHMHSVGIAHRDIKPQNVLLCSNRNSISGDYLLVVTDFGLSKVVTDQQQLAMSICEFIIQSMMDKKIAWESAFRKTRQQPSNEYKQLVRSMLNPDSNRRIRMINITNHPWIVREYAMAESTSRSLRSSMRSHHHH